MKKYTKKQVVVSPYLDKIVCDCCGAESHRGSDWSDEYYISTSATLSASQTCDGDYDCEEVDICPDCAKWLMEQIKNKKLVRAK